MRLPTITLFLFICCTQYITASTGNYSAKSAGISGASIADPSPGIYIDNHALLGLQSNFAVGANYFNRFGLQELGTQTVHAMHPLFNGGIGYRLSYFGTSSYNEIQTGLSYGLKLFEKLALGASADYYRTSLETLQEKQKATAGEIGLLYFPTNFLCIGVQATKIGNSNYFNYERNKLTSGVRSGISYSNNYFIVYSEAEIPSGDKPVLKFGSEIKIIENLQIRLGVSNGHLSKYSFGAGYQLKNFVANLGFSQHPYLGLSSHVGIGYYFNQHKP